MNQKTLNVVLCLVVAGLVVDRFRPADEVRAKRFVVVSAGQKVGHFGLHKDHPGEVVFLLRTDARNFVGAVSGPDMSGLIVKSRDEERAMTTGRAFAFASLPRP